MRAPAWMWSFVAVLSLAATAFAQDVVSADAAQVLVKEGRLADARIAYTTLATENRDAVDYWVWKARLESWVGDYAKAEATFGEVHRRWPANLEAWIGHVYLSVWQERFADAERYLEAAVALAPDDLGVNAAHVRYLRARHRRAEAQRLLAAIANAHPDHPETRSLRAEIRSMEGPVSLNTGVQSDRALSGESSTTYSVGLSRAIKGSQVAASIGSLTRRRERPRLLAVSGVGRIGRRTWLSGELATSFGSREAYRLRYRVGASRRVRGDSVVGGSLTRVVFPTVTTRTVSGTLERPLTDGVSVAGAVSHTQIRWVGRDAASVGGVLSLRGTLTPAIVLSGSVSASTTPVERQSERDLSTDRNVRLAFGITARIRPRTAVVLTWEAQRNSARLRSAALGINLQRSW